MWDTTCPDTFLHYLTGDTSPEIHVVWQLFIVAIIIIIIIIIISPYFIHSEGVDCVIASYSY